ncbi:hypothetical protein RCH22_001914 [Cryobacterium psychrotolerans]|nr:hypothetical protein [Cryobacterium psychrotolerans]
MESSYYEVLGEGHTVGALTGGLTKAFDVLASRLRFPPQSLTGELKNARTSGHARSTAAQSPPIRGGNPHLVKEDECP